MSHATRGLLAILSGTSLGQLVSLAAIPAIARLYSPDQVGELAVITALAYIGTTVAAGRYELAIALPRDDGDAAILAGLAIRIAIGFGLVGCGICISISGIAGLRPLGLDLESLLFVFALSAIGGIFGALNYLAVRGARFSAVAKRNFVRAVAVSSAQILAGLTPMKVIGLPAGLLFGEAVATGSMARLRGLPKSAHSRPERRLRRRQLARTYARFPILLTPSSLVNSAGQHGAVALVSLFFGVTAVGFLGMAQRAVAAPVGLVTTAVSQVYISSFARSIRERQPGTLVMFRVASRRLLIAGLLVGAGLVVLAPPLLQILLGSGWARAGDFVQALAPLVATQVLAKPLSQTLVLLQHTALQFIWDVSRLVAVVCALLFSSVAGLPALNAVWIYSIVAAILNCIAWLLSRWAVLRYERSLPTD